MLPGPSFPAVDTIPGQNNGQWLLKGEQTIFSVHVCVKDVIAKRNISKAAEFLWRNRATIDDFTLTH